MAETAFEFPRVAPCVWLSSYRHAYGVCEYFGAPIHLDVETGVVTRFWTRPGDFAGELVPVPKAGVAGETNVWLLGLVLTRDGESELRIFDGAEVGAPPVARARLPHVIPFDFHGSWLPKNGQTTLP